ncbi:unnamed protein product [Parnassius apollo]|uniref:(apollo) hypothetical protein n=1 Tax=Parnassius apollo TaxID=110799 RepID=A0A8S3Y2E5_PARAO|nr:unnamed protein product [Parnassius apollo]
MSDIPILISSDDSESSNDYIKNLPSVDFQSSFSSDNTASSSTNGSRPTTRSRGKRKSLAKTKQAAERNTAKEKLAEQKAAKRKAQKLNKIYKPGECMKYMKIEMHPTFLEKWYTDDIEHELSMCGAKVLSSSDLFTTGLVLWKRSVPPSLVSINGQVEMTTSQEYCDRGLYVITANDVVAYVCEHTLAKHVAQIRDMADVKLTLVIFGVQDYFKHAGKKTKQNKDLVMTEIDLEMAITDLLVSTGCDAVLLDHANELTLLITQFTKAIAEAPYKKAKRECDEKAEFYMRGDNKKCVPVDKDGNGISRLWQQMIAVLPHCSLETSRALCAQYTTPLALYESLQSPEGVKAVADLGVSRAGVPGSRARRIGPEFARKLQILFTAEDGNTLLD